jgi:hypothetical protein
MVVMCTPGGGIKTPWFGFNAIPSSTSLTGISSNCRQNLQPPTVPAWAVCQSHNCHPVSSG